MKPRLLDLFCGAGGAAMGYHRAGFEVVGVDIKPQPHYPFEFHQGDAMTYPLDGFDAIHASPPCQAYCISLNAFKDSAERRNSHPKLIEPTRERLKVNGKPFVIENVTTAPLRPIIQLCGEMFGLRVFRHRNFETSFLCLQPQHQFHRRKAYIQGLKPPSDDYVYTLTGHCADAINGALYMGIDWMKKQQEIVLSIPPAYTEFIGRQLMEYLK